MPKKLAKKHHDKSIESRWGVWQTIAVTLFAYTLATVSVVIVSVMLGTDKIGQAESEFAVYAIFTAVILGASLRFMKYRGIKLKQFFAMPSKRAFWSIFYYFLLYMILTIALQEILKFLPWYNVNQVQDVGFDYVDGGVALALVFVALVILPPIGEEVLFRGIIYPGLKSKLKKVTAAVVTSLLFGLAHLQWNVGADTFVLSMVAILGYETQKTIWVPIGIHAVKNFVAFLFLFVFPPLGG